MDELMNLLKDLSNKDGQSSSSKMYWKQGFHDRPIEGGIEITGEYWQQLLDGQSAGFEIYEDDKGYPILDKHRYNLDEKREEKVMLLSVYDKSEEVNSFKVNEEMAWLSKSDRVGLRDSIKEEMDSGRTETSIWLNGSRYVLPVNDALDMLRQIELYAIDCNNVTRESESVIKELSTIEQIDNYDITKGYPPKLTFKLKKYAKSIL